MDAPVPQLALYKQGIDTSGRTRELQSHISTLPDKREFSRNILQEQSE